MARFKFAIPLEAHWKVLARTMGHAEFADDPGFATIAGRCANRDACNTIALHGLRNADASKWSRFSIEREFQWRRSTAMAT
jgi:hypothetical protein